MPGSLTVDATGRARAMLAAVALVLVSLPHCWCVPCVACVPYCPRTCVSASADFMPATLQLLSWQCHCPTSPFPCARDAAVYPHCTFPRGEPARVPLAAFLRTHQHIPASHSLPSFALTNTSLRLPFFFCVCVLSGGGGGGAMTRTMCCCARVTAGARSRGVPWPKEPGESRS